MSLPKPLMFTVGLVDQITKPIAKISQQFNGLASNYQAGTMQMATGVGGMAAAGMALQSALMPAIEMDRVLGEVKSLGVRDSALKQLSNTAYEYSLKYGKSATEFVSSSYDIQSAISGLNDSDLSQFTLASNVLATATKADAATITNYMGTMYGIFKNEANAIGKSEWVNQITGMTATAVQAFKTTGAEMSGAFTAIGAQAQSAGIGMHEQMAILGTLQATMSGSESGTKYKSFLAGVGKAQKALNLQFTDAQGAMLPMVDILTKIKGKYGDTLDVAEGDALAKAFGSQEAVATVKLLMNDIDGLSGSINKLGQVKGMGQAEIMAAAMTDQSERLSQSWYVIRAAFGSAVLPAFNEFVGWIADMGKDVLWFTQTFPNLTRVLGYSAIAILGLVAAGGAFTVMMGVGKMAMVAWNLSAMVTSGIYKILTLDITRLGRQMKLMPYFMQRWARTSKIAAAAQWALNIAMNANPVGLVVAGVAALIGVVGLAVYCFDDLRAMMEGTAWGEPILFAVDAIADLVKTLGGVAMSVFGAWFDILGTVFNALKPLASFLLDVVVFNLKIMGGVWAVVFGAMAYGLGGLVNGITWVVTAIADGFSWAFDIVSAGWNDLISWFTNDAWMQYLLAKVINIGSFFSSMWNDIKAVFAETWGWIADKLNMLPGIDIDLTPVMGDVAKQQIPGFIQSHNQQAVPTWMQQNAANDLPNAVPMNGPWLNAASTVQTTQMQQLDIKPVANETMASAISPRINQQAAMSAKANRVASQSTSKSLSFGDVIIKNPPKNFSLAEIADQRELMTG